MGERTFRFKEAIFFFTNFIIIRAEVVLGVLANLIRFLSLLFEPFMPSFAAKINYILGRENRNQEDDVLIEILVSGNEHSLLKLLPPGQTLNKPVPLFEQSLYFLLFLTN
jgi:methionyl-tRNA synthetase